MSEVLPGWVVSDAASIECEAAPYREMTPAERLRLLAAACRAGARLLRSRVDAEAAVTHRDPLPQSSLEALARLRRRARGHGGV